MIFGLPAKESQGGYELYSLSYVKVQLSTCIVSLHKIFSIFWPEPHVNSNETLS